MKAKPRSKSKDIVSTKNVSKAAALPPGKLDPAPRPPVQRERTELYLPHFSQQDYDFFTTSLAKLEVKSGAIKPSLIAQAHALTALLKVFPTDAPPKWLDSALAELQAELIRVRGLHIRRFTASGMSPPPKAEK
jgi:hypothetical protein